MSRDDGDPGDSSMIVYLMVVYLEKNATNL